MTNFEKYFKDEKTVAKLLIEGMSSDVCDYCKHNDEGDCNDVPLPCCNMEDTEIVEIWLKSEVEE